MDPEEMSDTEKGDIGLETQQDSNTSDEDTQAATGTQSSKQRSKLGFYVPFNSQGLFGTGPQNCHLWDSNPQR